jgi:hypothetical protein
VEVPRVAVLLAVMVSTLVPFVVGLGLKVAVTPEAIAPPAVRVTAPAELMGKFPSGVKLIVAVTDCPRARVFGIGLTFRSYIFPKIDRATVVVSLNAPEVPVIVTTA